MGEEGHPVNKRRKVIEETVLDILKHANLETATELSVRTAAADRLAVDRFDLDEKRLVRALIESFLLSDAASTTTTLAGSDDGNSKAHELEIVQQQQPSAQEIVKSPHGGADSFENNGRIICKLSDKRFVAIQDFRGQFFVSIRDYHQKDGKQFPSARGISLTAKQWSSFRNFIPSIEAAIFKMKSKIRLDVVRKTVELDAPSSMDDTPQGLGAFERKQRVVSLCNSSSVVSPQHPTFEGRYRSEVDNVPPNPEHHIPTTSIQLLNDTCSPVSAFASQEHPKHESSISIIHPRFVPFEPTRLNGKNYYSWKHQMEVFLGQMKLAYVLAEPCPSFSPASGSTVEETVEAKAAAQKWVDDDYICRHNILNLLSDNLYDIYSKKPCSAKELWEELILVYEEKFGTKRSEINKYIHFQMVDDVSILPQVEELNKISSSLLASGIWIEEYFHVSVIISKLPPSWREFRWRLMCEEFLPLNMLMHRLRIEEDSRNGKTEKLSKDARLVELKLENKVGSRRRETKRLCYTCGKEGHISKYCPDRKLETCENGNTKDNDVVPMVTEVSINEGTAN